MSALRIVSIASVALTLALGLPSVVRADTVYRVLIGGRPLDTGGGSARLHKGRIYVNLVRATRALAGILTFHDRDQSDLVSVGGHTVSFRIGTRNAMIDGAPVVLAGAPYMESGDTFVPLETLARVAGATFTTNGRAHVVLLAPATPPLVVPTSLPT